MRPDSQGLKGYTELDSKNKGQEVEKSSVFAVTANKSLSGAVDEANGVLRAVDSRNLPYDRAVFAPIFFPPERCYGTDQSWLWKMEQDPATKTMKTNDHMFETRKNLLFESGLYCKCEPLATCISEPSSPNVIENADSTPAIADEDAKVCKKYQRDKLDAVGHPNVEGANNYDESIIREIRAKWPTWLYPTVEAFDVSSRSLTSGESLEISYKVSDNGGSVLKQVELWRTQDKDKWPESPENPVQTTPLSGQTGPFSGSFTDSPSGPGTYWYGVHVVDNAGNWNDQKNSNTNGQPSGFEPVEVEVLSKDFDQIARSEFILFAGTPLMLKDGYELTLKSLDIDGNKIYLELSKDGQIVDSSVIRPPNNVEATYAYTKDKGQIGAVPVIKVHFKNSFRGLDQNLTTVDSIWQVSEINPSNVIRDSNDRTILTSEEPLRLEEGYELALKATDIDGNKVYVELSRNGEKVDSSVVIPSNDFDHEYSYTINRGQSDAIQTIKVHFRYAFRGEDQYFATIDRIWQISESAPFNMLRSSNETITLASGEPLTLEEGYELVLKEVDIDGNRIYVDLMKNGQKVDSLLILPGGIQRAYSSAINLQNELCEYYAYSFGKRESGSAPTIVVHFQDSFRGVDQDLATIDSIWQASESSPSNVLRSSNDPVILTKENSLRLEEGYELVLKASDVDGNKVLVGLSRNGQEVDSAVISPPNNVEATYAYIKDDRQIGAVPLLSVHFKNSFRGANISMATMGKDIQPTEIPIVDDAITWCKRGNDLYCQKKYQDAIQNYEKAIELNPNLADAWDGKSDSLFSIERYEEALQAYGRTIELDPNSTNAWFGKGITLYFLDNCNEAVQAYERTIELQPDSVSAWIGKGEALNFLGKYDEALQAYDKSIEQYSYLASNGELAIAWNGKGDALWMQNKNDEALQSIERAIELDPNLASAWDGKGTVLSEQGKYDEAIKYFDEAIWLEPEVGIYWDNKGDALKGIGKYNEADTAYAKAKELGYIDPGYKTLVKSRKY